MAIVLSPVCNNFLLFHNAMLRLFLFNNIELWFIVAL